MVDATEEQLKVSYDCHGEFQIHKVRYEHEIDIALFDEWVPRSSDRINRSGNRSGNLKLGYPDPAMLPCLIPKVGVSFGQLTMSCRSLAVRLGHGGIVQ